MERMDETGPCFSSAEYAPKCWHSLPNVAGGGRETTCAYMPLDDDVCTTSVVWHICFYLSSHPHKEIAYNTGS